MSKKQRVVFKFEPLSASELLQLANKGSPIPSNRALATFGDPKNWIQIYHGETSRPDYEPRACEWAFIGPVRPPYELAQHGLENPLTIDDIMDALNDAFQASGSPTSRDCVVAENLRKILAHRTRVAPNEELTTERVASPDDGNGG